MTVPERIKKAMADEIARPRDRCERAESVVERLGEERKLLDALRSPEGASVTFCCTNPDTPDNGLPAECVVVVDDWTNWQDREFRGETLLDCMMAAEADRAARQEPHP